MLVGNGTRAKDVLFVTYGEFTCFSIMLFMFAPEYPFVALSAFVLGEMLCETRELFVDLIPWGAYAEC